MTGDNERLLYTSWLKMYSGISGLRFGRNYHNERRYCEHRTYRSITSTELALLTSDLNTEVTLILA